MVGMTDEAWACPELSETPQDWIVATENGWGALVLWAAGPDHSARVRAAPGPRYGVMSRRLPEGGEESRPYKLTAADLSLIDDDIDEYLAEAGIPPRPRGFDWYIQRPSIVGVDDEAFWAEIWEAATEGLPATGARPSALAGPVGVTMAGFYKCENLERGQNS
ncbi:DUF5956 family protein [Paenarthrobacter ilicis]